MEIRNSKGVGVKRLWGWVVVVALGAGLTLAQAAELQEGFSGIPWGASVSQIEGLSKVKEKGDVSYYTKPGTVFMVQEMTLDKVLYGFYQGQFFAAYISIPSEDMFDEVENYLLSFYGQPRSTMTLRETIYIWQDDNVKIKLKVNDDTGQRKLAFYYKPLNKRLNEANQDQQAEKTLMVVPVEKGDKAVVMPLIK